MLLKTLNKNETDTFIMLLDLVEKVASKYEGEDLVAVGMRGLSKGLKSYTQHGRKEFNIATYVTWFIREEIHKLLGIEDNEEDYLEE